MKGFTLAEVLITLGIIGVVAAITIPNVVQNYQKKVFSTRLKKTFSDLNQAIKFSQIENGDVDTWELPDEHDNNTNLWMINSRNFAEKYIVKYLKGAEFCDTGMTDSMCAKYVGCGTGAANYQLADGTLLSVSAISKKNGIYIRIVPIRTTNLYRSFNRFILKTSGTLLPDYYVEGYSREKYIKGFTFYKYDGNHYTVSCKKNSTAQYPAHACAALLYLDNFEVKDDYPW